MGAERGGTGAVVLGASYRSIGVVRSLGRRGIPVCVLHSGHHTIACRSRYARERRAWPADAPADEAVAFLLELAHARGGEGWTLIPTDDEGAALVSRHRDALSDAYVVATPAWEQMRWAYDKRLTHQLGAEAGIDQPRTWLPGPDGFDQDDLAFPAVLKPAFKRTRNRFTDEKAWPVGDRAELAAAFAAARELVALEEILLQERIDGGGDSQLSFAALASDGRVIASVTACRERQYPMDFGRESTYVRTIEAPDVESASAAALAHIGYSGLVELEFKRDPRDGRAKLLDVNPRVWGWQSLGARAGVDFVYLQWRLLHGDEPAPARGRAGVGWVRGATDLATCARELLKGRAGPSSLATRLRGPRGPAIFALDDPLPALLDGPLLARSVLRR